MHSPGFNSRRFWLAAALLAGVATASVAQDHQSPPGVVVNVYPGDVTQGYRTTLGEVRVTCQSAPDSDGAGVIRYALNGIPLLQRAAACAADWGAPQLAYEAIYPTGERILAVTAGSGLAGTFGAAVRLAPGERPSIIDVEYMLEWGEVAPTAATLRFVAAGAIDLSGDSYWTCEMDVDWSTQTVRSIRTIDGPAMCGDGQGAPVDSARGEGEWTSTTPAPTDAKSIIAALVGAWVPEDTFCASDGALVFETGGVFSAGGLPGRWRNDAALVELAYDAFPATN